MFAGFAAFMRGDLEEALSEMDVAQGLEAPGTFSGNAEAFKILYLTYLQRKEEALSLVEALWSDIVAIDRNTTFAHRDAVSTAAESLFLLGESAKASQLYDSLQTISETGAIGRSWDFRLNETVMALSAAAAEDFERADRHHEKALETAARLSLLWQRADIHRFRAIDLLRRDPESYRAVARELLEEALPIYRKQQMKHHIRLTEELLAEVS
jgi:tetratricopeptide (TPR) repeat protein